MDPVRRLRYLEALGIEVFVPKDAPDPVPESAFVPGHTNLPERVANDTSQLQIPAEPESWVIGPGHGQTLMLCADPAQSSTALAADIARYLDPDPVWAWPADGESAALPLEHAVRERLLTRVVDFGLLQPDSAAAKAVGEMKSVDWITASGLGQLGEDPAARQSLWAGIAARGWFKLPTGT